MATSKTLTPTNQTISIPELSDAPDMSVASDAISKEADAINALSEHIEYVLTSGSLKTYATNAPGGFSCFRYNNSVTDTPCDYGHGYLIKYGQNYRFEVYDMVSLNAYTAYSNNSGSTWSEWLSLSDQIGHLYVVSNTVNSLAGLVTLVKTYSNGDNIRANVDSSVINALSNSTTTYDGIVDIIKVSNNNCYYHVFNNQIMAYGNLQLSTGNVNIINDLNNQIALLKPINFGDVNKTLTQNLTSYWTTSVPNDTFPRLCIVTSQGGSWFGYINRYSGNYGAGMFARYDGYSGAVFLNNGTVTIKTLAYQT